MTIEELKKLIPEAAKTERISTENFSRAVKLMLDLRDEVAKQLNSSVLDTLSIMECAACLTYTESVRMFGKPLIAGAYAQLRANTDDRFQKTERDSKIPLPEYIQTATDALKKESA